MISARIKSPWPLLAWTLLFLVCVAAYWPGLKGPFVFDDFASIADLGDLGGVTDWNTFKAFVFGGHSGPTGRPLALLTFLIDANNWPADPWPFKRTNLIIHLLNAALLGVLTRLVLRVLDTDAARSRWVTLVAVGAWMLHPFLVSTTLYAVQRMAQLSTLFVFVGLAGYLLGRMQLSSNAKRAYWIMTFSIGLCTLLGMLAKENAILLPVLAGVAEITIVASRRGQLGALNRTWAALFLVLPTVVIALYLGERLFRPDFLEVAAKRDFSIYERLLTQARILMEYLSNWFVPQLYTTGVFQDHVLPSRGLLSPATTLLSILLHMFAISVLLVKRNKWPLLAFAGLFFYAGHLLESTLLNLELYFEHRNYLSAAFLLLPLTVAVHAKAGARGFATVSVIVLCGLAGFTRYSADIWSSYPRMVEASAQKAPTSARAQQQYALNLFNAQRYDEALAVIESAITSIPARPELQLTRLTMLCENGALSAEQFAASSSAIAELPYDARSLGVYQRFVNSVAADRCREVATTDLTRLFSSMLENTANNDPALPAYSQLQFLLGLTYARTGDGSRTIAAFERSLSSRPGAGHAMMMAAVLANNAMYAEALQLSDIALTDVRKSATSALQGTRVSEADILDFQEKVREAAGD